MKGYISETFKNIILTKIIPSLFPKLIKTHCIRLCKYVIRLMNVIIHCFNIKTKNYIVQFTQNDYQDVKWLILHLLPFGKIIYFPFLFNLIYLIKS